jgi:hypothetical protein
MRGYDIWGKSVPCLDGPPARGWKGWVAGPRPTRPGPVRGRSRRDARMIWESLCGRWRMRLFLERGGDVEIHHREVYYRGIHCGGVCGLLSMHGWRRKKQTRHMKCTAYGRRAPMMMWTGMPQPCRDQTLHRTLASKRWLAEPRHLKSPDVHGSERYASIETSCTHTHTDPLRKRKTSAPAFQRWVSLSELDPYGARMWADCAGLR